MNSTLFSTILILAVSLPAFGGEKTECYPTLATPSGTVLRLELAQTDLERAYGLMFRASMPEDTGMLFVFDHCESHSFWMKNCFFPLDILWLDREGRILAAMENLPPCRTGDCPNYDPGVKACYVLEVNGGRASVLGLKEGVRLDLSGALKRKPPALLKSHGRQD